ILAGGVPALALPGLLQARRAEQGPGLLRAVQDLVGLALLDLGLAGGGLRLGLSLSLVGLALGLEGGLLLCVGLHADRRLAVLDLRSAVDRDLGLLLLGDRVGAVELVLHLVGDDLVLDLTRLGLGLGALERVTLTGGLRGLACGLRGLLARSLRRLPGRLTRGLRGLLAGCLGGI